MDRISKKQVQGIFEMYLIATGRKIAQSYDNVGDYRLDYNGIYGGFRVEKLVNEGGGVSYPFGDMRRKARDMWETLHFALRAHEDLTR